MYKRWLTLVLGASIVTAMALPAGAEAPVRIEVVERGDDVRIEIGEPGESLAPLATDPLGLIVGVDTIRQHTLGEDVFDVWTCGVPESAGSYVADMQAEIGPYFEFHSRGRYRPRFVPKGSAGSDTGACVNHSTANASADANGALHVTPTSGGFASPGIMCGFTPCSSELYRNNSQRYGFVGSSRAFLSTVAHEMGHMLHWPHSHTGSGDDYDNAADLMSGNYGIWDDGRAVGSFDDPYATAVINLYAAGWIDPTEVRMVGGGAGTFELVAAGGSGVRMAVIPAGDRYYTLGLRVPGPYDPIPPAWAGVEVYEIETCAKSGQECIFEQDKLPGFRRVKPHPAVSFPWSDPDAYTEPLPHVIPPGGSRTVGSALVEVGSLDGNRIQVSITGPAFGDIGGNVFASDIEWLADSGITKGCNPPTNTLFCPDEPVTRGQMAAFLHRALPDLATGAATDFRDDNGLVFESDVEWLSATGVTRGCNPPTNDRFCPHDTVTRAQMAAFLHRALPDLVTDAGSVDFVDDNGSVFEADIEWLAATGVTRGCNPPTNDRFCPNAPVTRGAMAAFLHRALGS